MTHAGSRHIASPAALPTRHAGPARRKTPWLGIIGGVAMLAALASVLGTGAFAAGLRVVGPWSAAAALAIGLFSTVCTALRWRAIARRVGLRLEVAEAVAESYRAVFLNSVLPGGVLGDVDRARRHGRGGDVAKSARVVVLERTAGQLVLIGAALLVLPAHPGLVPSLIGGVRTTPIMLVGVLIALLAALSVVVMRARRTGAVERWRATLGKAMADLRSGVLARGAWPSVLLLSAGALAGYLGLFLVAAYAAGAHAAAWELLPLLLLALMAMGLPISVGGWGPREGVAAVSFWMAGLGAPLGVTVAVAYGVLTLIASLPGAFVVLLGLGRSRRAAAQAAPAPDAQTPTMGIPGPRTPGVVAPLAAAPTAGMAWSAEPRPGMSRTGMPPSGTHPAAGMPVTRTPPPRR